MIAAFILAAVTAVATFSSVPGASFYLGQRQFGDGKWQRLYMYENEARTIQFTPIPGPVQKFYFWTEAPLRSDQAIRIVACNKLGCAPVSNLAVVSTGLGAGLYALYRPGKAPLRADTTRAAAGRAAWAFPYGDSSQFVIVRYCP